SESVILRVLVHGGETPAMAPLVAALAANAALEVISRPAADPLLPDGAHVVLAAGERPPDDAELRAVAGHVQAGGGLVLLGAAAGLQPPGRVAVGRGRSTDGAATAAGAGRPPRHAAGRGDPAPRPAAAGRPAAGGRRGAGRRAVAVRRAGRRLPAPAGGRP